MRQHAMQYLCVALPDEQKWWVLVRRVPQHHGHSPVAPSVEKSGGPTNLWGLNVPLNRAK